MKYIIISVCVFSFVSCAKNKITNEKDYTAFLTPKYFNEAAQKNQQEIAFWTHRLQKDTGSYVNKLELGYNYISLFKLTGHIENLKTGDSLLKSASAKLNNSDPGILQALAQVSITQHQFSNAAAYNQSAYRKNGSAYIHSLLSFDAGMELGWFSVANKSLVQLNDQSSFDFLIRKAKFQDHSGVLQGAIKTMEKAFKKIKNTNKVHLYCWTLSNLGDMYGHAGRIKESYNAYLKILRRDPAYLYALKGIAWIAYSHDGDLKEAERILKFIK
ncbi:MAG: tetratricopeptide repeat protein, partial [Chitinophagaceae bacterium]|nr:tetratricopeptide repeat protein [Chitinophagaceae bacterium]